MNDKTPDKKGQEWNKFTEKKKETFLETLSHGWSPRRAAETCGVSHQIVYVHRKKDPDFRAAWEEALIMAQQEREDELNTRAFKGEDMPIVHGGKIMKEKCEVTGAMIPVKIKRKSDILLMFSMKAESPEKYKEKSAVEHLGLEGLADQFKALQDASKKADLESSERGNTRDDKTASPSGDGEM